MVEPTPQHAQIPRRRTPWGCIACLVVTGFFFFLGFGFLFLFIIMTAEKDMGFGAGIAVIPIEGILISGETRGTMVAGTRTIAKFLKRARERRRVRALVLWIDSPGGSAAAAQEIYRMLRQFKKETKKPLVAALGDVAASGGYYVAVAADRIYALPATLTGSIGVLWENINLERLLGKLGIEAETLKAGRFKDIGSPFRPMTKEERKLIQRLLQDVHDQFIADVAKGRKLSPQKIRRLADGRILTGKQALKAGLVDELGGLEEAIAFARRQANLPKMAPVWIWRERKTFFELLLETQTPPLLPQLLMEPLLLLDFRVSGQLLFLLIKAWQTCVEGKRGWKG